MTAFSHPPALSPDVSTHPPARLIFEVPELVGLICSFVEKSSLIKILTVSRCFFYSAAPAIWKEVSGVEKLLVLLPKSDVEKSIWVNPNHLQPCDRDQLARFNIYAPFIQKIESDSETDKERCWDLLLSRVPTRPLLPNLRALVINPQGLTTRRFRLIEYIDALLCPTLSSVYTTQDYNIWTNPFETRDLLTRMAAICPGLTKLNILPGNSRYPDNLLSFVPYYPTSVFIPISQFHDLRVLHSSFAVLNPDVLHLLGNLPRLESLGAYSISTDEEADDDDILIANLRLLEYSFPALRHLDISCVPGMVVSALWQTPPLVRNLVSVKVQFMHDDDAEALSDLICAVCQGSPRVTDLELDLIQSGGVELSSTVAEHICRLPLLRLQIWDGNMECRSLALSLPNVEYLNIESVHVNYQELALIAKHMPKLQYLHAELLLWHWPSDFNSSLYPPSPSPCRIDSCFTFEEDLEMNVDDPVFTEELDKIARGLHALWPRGVYGAFGDLGLEEQGESDPRSLARLNEMTKALSGTSALEVPTAEESGSRWLYASW